MFKITDHATRWKDVLLRRTKSDVKVAIRRFNLDVVVPHIKRVLRLRVDKGGNVTSKEV